MRTSLNGNSTLVTGKFDYSFPPSFLSPTFSFEEMLHISQINSIREEHMSKTLVAVI